MRQPLFFLKLIVLIDAVNSHLKKGILSLKIFGRIVIREGNVYFHGISRMGSDELLFKVVNIKSGADGQICALSISAAAVKLYSVNGTYIVDVDGIPVLYSKRGVCRQGGRAGSIAFLRVFGAAVLGSTLGGLRFLSVLRTGISYGICYQDNDQNQNNEPRETLVNTFVNAIYLYDDKILLTFNYKEGTKTISLDDVAALAASGESGSDLGCLAPPKDLQRKLRVFFAYPPSENITKIEFKNCPICLLFAFG